MPSDLEARVSCRLMLRIIPFVMLLYFVSFLDRVNVGFAAITMNKAIGLSPTAFGLGGGLFFVGYFLFEVPSNLILQRVGARLWIARVMLSWGMVSAASAFVVGPNSFYALRFALGVAEAGFFPGIILYLSLWFPARQRALAAAWFMAAAPISTAIGSPISGAIMKLSPIAGLSDWQMLYILEAVPAIILGFVVLKYLTDSPSQAHWLQSDERDWLIARLAAEAEARQSHAGHTARALSALRDPRVLARALIYFGTSAGLYTLGLWAPLIIRQYGFGSFEIGLLACLGFVLVGQSATVVTVIVALVIANIGISAAKAPLWAMPSLFLSGAGAAAGIALINSVGNLGGFVGPFAIGWLKSVTGSYAAGLYVVAATLALSAIVTLMLSRQATPAPAATGP